MFFGFNVDASGRQFRATLFPKKLFFSKHNFEQITLIIEPHILIISNNLFVILLLFCSSLLVSLVVYGGVSQMLISNFLREMKPRK